MAGGQRGVGGAPRPPWRPAAPVGVGGGMHNATVLHGLLVVACAALVSVVAGVGNGGGAPQRVANAVHSCVFAEFTRVTLLHSVP